MYNCIMKTTMFQLPGDHTVIPEYFVPMLPPGHKIGRVSFNPFLFKMIVNTICWFCCLSCIIYAFMINFSESSVMLGVNIASYVMETDGIISVLMILKSFSIFYSCNPHVEVSLQQFFSEAFHFYLSTF